MVIGRSRPLNALPWLLLPARTLLFAGWQAIVALIYLAAGASDAWSASAAWWPWTVTLTNVICLVVLARLTRAEGMRFPDLLRVDRRHFRTDALPLAGVLVLVAPLAFLPNILAASWLFGDPQVALDLFIRPLPLWAAVGGALLFGLTQGLTELPFYFGVATPRLEGRVAPPWMATVWPALFLTLQHIAVPLLPDWRFILWRLVMFLPFALFLGAVLRWRPRLLPYLMIAHALMDLSLAPMVILASL